MAMLVYQRVCLLFLVVLVVSGVSQFDFPFKSAQLDEICCDITADIKEHAKSTPQRSTCSILGPGYSL